MFQQPPQHKKQTLLKSQVAVQLISMLVLFKDWCENITSVSEGLGLDLFYSIFALGIFYWLKHFVHFRIKKLKTIYYKSKLRLKAHIWLEP